MASTILENTESIVLDRKKYCAQRAPFISTNNRKQNIRKKNKKKQEIQQKNRVKNILNFQLCAFFRLSKHLAEKSNSEIS